MMSRQLAQHLPLLGFVFLAVAQFGCEVDSFFDPSVTGRWETTATTIPILTRLDVVERQHEQWGQISNITPEDLTPNVLDYRIEPGDVVTIEIFELYTQGQWTRTTRRIDAGGFIRIPEIGEELAAGLTPQELQDRIEQTLSDSVMSNPEVDVVVEDAGGFTWTIYGYITQPGIYTLLKPDFRLIEALAQSGGVPATTQYVYVIRQLPLSPEMQTQFDRGQMPAQENGSSARPTTGEKPVDVDSLIDQLEKGGASPSPGILAQDGPIVDVDELQPIEVSNKQPIDIVDVTESSETGTAPSYIYVKEKGQWVEVKGSQQQANTPMDSSGLEDKDLGMFAERVLAIPYQELARGESSYNIVIRPNDQIYVDGPQQGVVYIDGQISRPGVYNLPQVGRLTLSRLVAAAGGPGPLAIPRRVDLTRVIGDNWEATVRLNLAAIRQRTEPDIYLRPDDHVIIGTSFWATPLAVIRNGFRFDYGFGFFLERNFGYDVWGAGGGGDAGGIGFN
jgi:polysaccharide export outer membrane protein